MWFIRNLVISTTGCLLFFSTASVAESIWKHNSLTCEIQVLSPEDEHAYLLETIAEEDTILPEDCLIGHWELIGSSYEENVYEMTADMGFTIHDIQANIEVIIDARGFTQSCVDVFVSGDMETNGRIANLSLITGGHTLALMSLSTEIPDDIIELTGETPYTSVVLSDSVTGTSQITVEGASMSTDIPPMFIAFSLLSTVNCSGDTLQVTTYPPGVDFVTTDYRRVH